MLASSYASCIRLSRGTSETTVEATLSTDTTKHKTGTKPNSAGDLTRPVVDHTTQLASTDIGVADESLLAPVIAGP